MRYRKETRIIDVREKFERRDFSKRERGLLERIYAQQYPGRDAGAAVSQAIEYFPHCSDEIAALYLQHVLKAGTVRNGTFFGHEQAFLVLGSRIADITADRYGGTQIYVGPLQWPWGLKAP